MKIYQILILLIIFFISDNRKIIYGATPGVQNNQGYNIPWFTGPFLAPTPINMKPGHPAIEPTVTIFKTYGTYNSKWKLEGKTNIWSINPLVDFQFGITDSYGIEILASCITNIRNGKNSTHLQDSIVFLGHQISNDRKGSWVPDCRLLIQTIFPTGKYQKLSPRMQGIDSTGFGSFQIGPVLAFRKLFYLPNNFFSLRGSIGYLFPHRVFVKGLNAYGGGFGTKGKVYPGQSLIAFFSGEYSLNQHWVLAFDSEFFFQKKSKFSGGRGTILTGGIANVGLPSSTQISFAPEIEYNFSQRSGLLAGIWFTVAGKNSAAFTSAFVAYVHIF